MMLLLLLIAAALAYDENPTLYEMKKDFEDSSSFEEVQLKADLYTEVIKRNEEGYKKRFAKCDLDAISFEDCQYHNSTNKKRQSITTQDRLVVMLQNTSLTNVSVLGQLLDPFHQRALQYGRGMYNTQNLAQLDKEAIRFYAETFGECYNFTGQPLVQILPGVFGYLSFCAQCGVLPCGAFLPYIIGLNATDPNHPIYNYRLVFDSDNLSRGVKKTWVNLAVGDLVLSLFNGTVSTPVGNVFLGNVLGFADYNAVNLAASDWSRPPNREIFRIATPFTSLQIFPLQFPNSGPTFGFMYNISPLRIIDECCNVGFGQITSTAAGKDSWTTPPLRKYNTLTAYFAPELFP